MSDDIKAAALRLRLSGQGRIYDAYGIDGNHPEFDRRAADEDCRRMRFRDLEIIADAYLAEHPADDDEPVTDERLIAFGFVEDADEFEWLHLFRFGVISVDRSEIEGQRINYWTISDKRGVVAEIQDRKTMGAVRRLCIELTS